MGGMKSKNCESETRQRLMCLNFKGEEAAPTVWEDWRSMGAETYAFALRGLADSELPADDDLRNLQIPALVLGIPGDPEHPVDAAQDLAQILPQSQLSIASSTQEAQETWALRIRDFLTSIA